MLSVHDNFFDPTMSYAFTSCLIKILKINFVLFIQKQELSKGILKFEKKKCKVKGY